MNPICIFISSVQKEFGKERRALRDYLTLEKLCVAHGSVPSNPLLAEPLYLTKYIERMGTGTRDMISRCVATELPEPQFAVTDGFTATLQRRSRARRPCKA